MEGPLGLEPRTPCLKGRCSNQLSYGPELYKDIILQGCLSMFAFARGLGKKQVNQRDHQPSRYDVDAILI